MSKICKMFYNEQVFFMTKCKYCTVCILLSKKKHYFFKKKKKKTDTLYD